MAVKTQQMGANPRVEVARSYTPASVGAKACTRNIHLNQNGERNSSGNVFRRLGQDVDLRDTLNRKQDQKLSQQSTAYNRHPKVTPRGQGGILIEDLYCAITAMNKNDMELIAAATEPPFNLEIQKARLPEGSKLPAIKAYKGKSNPQDHLDHFNDLIELHLVSKLAKVGFFLSP